MPAAASSLLRLPPARRGTLQYEAILRQRAAQEAQQAAAVGVQVGEEQAVTSSIVRMLCSWALLVTSASRLDP